MPTAAMGILCRATGVRRSRPPISPTVPHATICQGVQAPWPKKKLEASAVIAPVRNPDVGPKLNPAIRMTAVVGLKFGANAKAIRPTVATADISAIGTICRTCGRLRSKRRKNGNMPSSRISAENTAGCPDPVRADRNRTTGTPAAAVYRAIRANRPVIARHRVRSADPRR